MFFSFNKAVYMKFCKQTLQRSLSVFLNLGIGASSLGASRLVRRSFSLSAFHRSSANMSGLGKIPYASQDVQEVQKLISNLSSSTKNSSKPGKNTSVVKNPTSMLLGPQRILSSRRGDSRTGITSGTISLPMPEASLLPRMRRGSLRLPLEVMTSSLMSTKLMPLDGEILRPTPPVHTN